MSTTLPQPPYIYATQADAEAASNQLYLAQNPSGTTELLYGWFINSLGQYQLAVPTDQPAIAPPAPASPLTTAATQAGAALATGLTVTSASTPAVNGMYALDTDKQLEIASVSMFIFQNGDFPGGLSAYPWPDTSGGFHIFPSIAVFKEWSTVIANYIAALKLYGAGAPGATLPASDVTIA